MAKKTNDSKTSFEKKNISKDKVSKSEKISNLKSIIKKDKIKKDNKKSTKQVEKLESKTVTSKKKTSVESVKKSTPKTSTTSKVSSSQKEQPISIIEHYELPYRYNETIVKILYQTPNTLFVYWDISDKDRKKYIDQYGENFFNDTYPILIIHNDTYNYSFELPINDFANSWYLRVNDSKCNYRVELGRKPNYIPQPQIKVSNVDESPADEKIETPKTIDTNYIYISTSNLIELPNDHVLFKTNENNTIKFRNVKTKQEQNIPLYDIIKNLPVAEGSEIPLVSKEILEGLYSAIYKNEDTSFFENINNPSSGNPSSSSMPHS